MGAWAIFIDLLKSTFDLIKGIAWPLAILLIALIFKRDLKNILPRIRKAGPAGIELDSLEQQQRAPVPKEDRHTGLGPVSPIVELKEEAIRKDLELYKPEAREPALIRNLALFQFWASFENAYGIIFGSQIRALRQWNSVGRVNLHDARSFFEREAKAAFPEAYKDASFESWAEFLRARGFISFEGDEEVVTDLGREFLKFLSDRGYPENKYL